MKVVLPQTMTNPVPLQTDPLTKVMDPVKLLAALDSNTWSLKQPIESIIKKRAKQLQRRKTPAEGSQEDDAEEQLAS